MNDVELESWRAQWQTATVPAPPPSSELKNRVERETRIMRLGFAVQVAVTLAFGGGSLAWAILSRGTDAFALAFGICVFTAIAWAMSFFLWRDTWSPSALSTAAFLDLSIVRCTRRRQAIIAQVTLYVPLLAFDLAWIHYFGPARAGSPDFLSFLTSLDLWWVWLVTAILGIVSVRRWRKFTRELESLTSLRASLDDDTR
jgi:hypothetical protein